jgi:hypothetical protein
LPQNNPSNLTAKILPMIGISMEKKKKKQGPLDRSLGFHSRLT